MVSTKVSQLASNIESFEEIPIAELIEEKITKPAQEVFIDKGSEIPESYNVDTIRALVQDPFHIWVYWEVAEQAFNNLYKIFPPEVAASFAPVLKVTELTRNETTYANILKTGNFWVNVIPGKRYRIEVGMHSDIRGYIRLLEADEVDTPRGTISPNLAPEPEYQVSQQEFVENLQASGFAAFAGITDTEHTVEHLPVEVADLIASVTTGQELTEEQISQLPARLRMLLQELLSRGEQELASFAFFYLLPEYIREALAHREGLFEDALHPQHLAPRFAVGSSEHRPSPGRNPWLPSMAGRQLA